jgi:ParB family transcriptional regulator, chromosome partitioning protein
MENHEMAYDLSLRFGRLEGNGALPNARHIPLSQITPNPRQPRRNFDPDKMQELVESVREHGILQPVLVHEWEEGKYHLIAGERRFRAAQILGLETIPAIIRDFGEQKELEVALIENLQREDLNPVEIARAFHALMQEFGLTQHEIGARVGKSRSTITHILRLLELPEAMLNSLERGEIQEAHAKALLQIKEEALRERLYQQVIAGHLSVRETQKRIHAEQGEKRQPSRISPGTAAQTEARHPSLEDWTEQRMGKQLAHQYATRVEIRRAHTQGGNILIGYRNKADLLRIVDILLDMRAC